LTLRGVESLGSHGGFSGASIFRVECDQGEFALKVWPAERDARDILAIHMLMTRARAAGLNFVPQLVAQRDGTTLVRFGDSFAEIAAWQPGAADFRANPTDARLKAAVGALSRLHLAWREMSPVRGACPGVVRRLDGLQAWEQRERRESMSERALPLTLEALLPSCRDLVRRWLAPVRECLRPWLAVALELQPCVCDIWHDHVLFHGGEVTGLIDYGSVKADHVAVDLARLFGSILEDDARRRDLALDVYHSFRPLTLPERELVHVLDRTGVIVSLCNWLRWLEEGRSWRNLDAVAGRIETLVKRAGRWTTLLEFESAVANRV